MPSILSAVPLAVRVAEWGPSELARWSREMAISCANAGAPLRDAEFNLMPAGATESEAYLRAADPRWWRRKGARVLRSLQDNADIRAGQVGKGAACLYAGPRSDGWDAHKRVATAEFLKTAVLYDYATGRSSPLAALVRSDESKAARYYSFLKGLQELADDAGLRWAMLTITLPSEFHGNPEHGGGVYNGSLAGDSHREIAAGWNRMRAQLRKAGVVLSGVRTEEPMKDGTPHWHIGFFYKDDREFDLICRAVLTQFPAGLRIRTATPRKGRKLKFSAIQYAGLDEFKSGKFHRNVRMGAQCQIDMCAAKTGDARLDAQLRSFASYIIKYVAKSVGVSVADDVPSGEDSLIESGPAARVRQHRETYGIRGIEFFGIPKGLATAWDMLRQVKLWNSEGDALPVPEVVAELATICQRPKGQGVADFLRKLGGLAAAPGVASVEVKPLMEATTTRYRGVGSKPVGVQVQVLGGPLVSWTVKGGDREIMRADAAEAVRYAATEYGCISQFGDDAAALGRGLVQIGTVKTSLASQAAAIEAPVGASHTVLAAAGSGKTTVLASRVAYLVSQGVSPAAIVVAAFTREAAATIGARIEALGVKGVLVGTMHSLSGRWLSAMGVEASGFDDVIARATVAGSKAFHLLVDEAQDLSAAQWDWVHANGSTVFSVGDFRQAVYGWRGALPSGLQAQARATDAAQADFFTQSGLVELPVNRRSAAAIVGLANAIQSDASPSLAMHLGGVIERVKVQRLSDEVRAVLDWAGRASGSRAVLARTNEEVARLRAELTLAGFEGVAVQTIHGAKGGEWDSVCLACGPRKPSESSAEAREVYYVAVTRARSSLFITSVGQLPSVLVAGLVKLTGRVP